MAEKWPICGAEQYGFGKERPTWYCILPQGHIGRHKRFCQLQFDNEDYNGIHEWEDNLTST